MRILTAAFQSGADFLKHTKNETDTQGKKACTFYYPTKMDLCLYEPLLAEISFPDPPVRAFVQCIVTGFDAGGVGAWIRIKDEEVTTWRHLLAAASSEERPLAVPRYYPRFPANSTVRYDVKVGPGGNGRLGDLSAGGAFIRTTTPPPTGSDIHLTIGTPHLGQLELTGTVTWSQPGKGMGVRINPTSGDSRRIRRSLRRDFERGRASFSQP